MRAYYIRSFTVGVNFSCMLSDFVDDVRFLCHGSQWPESSMISFLEEVRQSPGGGTSWTSDGWQCSIELIRMQYWVQSLLFTITLSFIVKNVHWRCCRRLMRTCNGSDDIYPVCSYIHERLNELLPPQIIRKLTAASNSTSDETRSVFPVILLLRLGADWLGRFSSFSANYY